MNLAYNIINWYTRHLPFPHRGWKFFRQFLERFDLEKKSYQKKLHNGLIIEVSPLEHIQREIFWYGYYEKNSVLLWEKMIGEGSVVIDIGANIGYYSIIAAKKAIRGKVICFEPVSFLHKKIQKHTLINNLDNISIQPLAVGDRSGKCRIYISGSDNTGMSGLAPQENFSGTVEEADMITLDEWLMKHPQSAVNFIKIDTEGFELKVLQGTKETLRQNKPVIFIEVMSQLLSLAQNTPEEIYQFLNSLGYTAFKIASNNTLQSAPYGYEDYNLIFLPETFKLPSGISILP